MYGSWTSIMSILRSCANDSAISWVSGDLLALICNTDKGCLGLSFIEVISERVVTSSDRWESGVWLWVTRSGLRGCIGWPQEPERAVCWRGGGLTPVLRAVARGGVLGQKSIADVCSVASVSRGLSEMGPVAGVSIELQCFSWSLSRAADWVCLIRAF